MTTNTQQRLAAYLDAEAKILRGQEVRIGDKTFRRADLEAVQSMIGKLQAQLAREQAGSRCGGLRYSLANLNHRS